MKFRFQINGEIDYLSDTTPKTVVIFLSDHIKDDNIKLTGVSVHEMIEKKDKGSRKRRPYVRLADRH